MAGGIYGARQKECNKHSTDYRGAPCDVLIPPCAPHSDAIPQSAPSCKGRFSRENAAHLAKVAECLAKSAAIPYSVLPAQIRRKTVKVRYFSYQNAAHKFFTNWLNSC